MGVGAADKKEMDEYRVREDLRTLLEADKIKSDEKRLAAVRRHAAAEQKALGKVKKGD